MDENNNDYEVLVEKQGISMGSMSRNSYGDTDDNCRTERTWNEPS